jgi:hypothetical protein
MATQVVDIPGIPATRLNPKEMGIAVDQIAD